MVCYGRPPRRSGRRGDGPSVGAATTAEGVFIWKGAIPIYPKRGDLSNSDNGNLLRAVPLSPLFLSLFALVSCSYPADLTSPVISGKIAIQGYLYFQNPLWVSYNVSKTGV